ncbi:hypothetical protein [Rhodococcus jostii]|uniref:hypothetical protein n=1 Tax=Rhodococcus jostii TaxID=132919 RepID=UPI00362E62A8
MDPIDAVTSITRQVMRKLLGLDATPAEPTEVHIHVHLHGDQEAVETVKAQFPFRYRGKR